MTAVTLEQIRDVLNDRRRHCRALLELCRRQNGVIHAQEYSELMTILAQKQRILGRLDETSHRHSDLAREWKHLRETGQTDLREECEGLIAETEAILAELLQMEKEGTEQLCERRDATRRELQNIAQGARVNEVYRDNLAPVSHRHLDVGR